MEGVGLVGGGRDTAVSMLIPSGGWNQHRTGFIETQGASAIDVERLAIRAFGHHGVLANDSLLEDH